MKKKKYLVRTYSTEEGLENFLNRQKGNFQIIALVAASHGTTDKFGYSVTIVLEKKE